MCHDGRRHVMHNPDLNLEYAKLLYAQTQILDFVEDA